MALDPSIRYEDALSLEQASLTTRGRDNHLGTKELILQYNKVTNQSKEDMMEWLEQNRLTLTDPEFAFRTYEGTWHCVSIEYVEKGPFIQQRFKIDSSLLNDVAQRTQAGTAWKDYYWRIVDPRDYNIPEWTTTGATTPLDLDGVLWYDTHNDEGGETVYEGAGLSLWYTGSLWVITDGGVGEALPSNYYSSATLEGNYAPAGSWAGTPTVGFDSNIQWSKTANDNGDGTYDVTITRSEVVNQTGGSESRSHGETGDNTSDPSTSIFVSGGIKTGSNQEYTLHYEFATIQQAIPGETGIDGIGWYATGATVNGVSVYQDRSDTYGSWYDGSDYIISLVADINGTPVNYFISDTRIGEYEGFGTFSGDFLKMQSSLDPIQITGVNPNPLGPIYAEWRGTDDTTWRVMYSNYQFEGWRIASKTTWSADPWNDVPEQVEANHPYTNLNSSEWYDENSGGTPVSPPSANEYRNDLVVQIGKNPPVVTESTQVFTSADEASFVSDGGSIPDPVQGEDKQISNVPLDNGKFRVGHC